MKTSKQPANAISQKAYWNDPESFADQGQPLIFEIDEGHSVSFPRAHLLKYVANRDTLELLFPGATVTICSSRPRSVLKAILSGSISVLVRGNLTVGNADKQHGEIQGVKETEDPENQTGFVYTGIIEAHFDKRFYE